MRRLLGSRHHLGEAYSLDPPIVFGDMQIRDKTPPVLARDRWPAMERAHAAAQDLLVGTQPVGEVELDNRDLRFESAAGLAHSRGVREIPGRHRPAERSEEHTSELQSLMRISYAVFCLKKKNTNRY